MKSFTSNIFDKKLIINFLFIMLFFSYIGGNLLINLNIILILVFGFIFYKFEIFKIDYTFLDKLIIFSFMYVLLNGVYNNYYYRTNDISLDNTTLIKSIFYLRFLLLYFLINFFIKNNLINIKFFFIASSIAVIFVSLDLLYQFYYGYDIFGFEAVKGRRLSGPFGDELVAGSFIFRFGIFSFFLLPIFYKINNKFFLWLILILLFLLLFFALLLSGNRTPLFLFLITIACIFFFEKKIRKFFFLFVPLIIILVSLIYNFNQKTKDHLGSYKNKIISFFYIFSDENMISEEELEKTYRYDKKNNMFYTLEYKGNFYKINNTYIKEFKTGYLTWKVNKYFGGGIKSFIYSCSRANIPNCVNHPHNYYLEILSELGLFGMIIFFTIFLIITFKTFFKKYFIKSSFQNNYIITPFIFLFLMEIFPFRNTGSFFSTFSATYFFLILSILVSLIKKNNLIEKK